MKISIITVAFNAAATLEDTLKSVSRQSHPDVEHIVVDGGSRDGTPDVVAEFGRHVAKFISEPDRGLYDAMNKGLRLASGDIVAFLNADDWYVDADVLARVDACTSEGHQLVYGDLDFVDPTAPFTVRRAWRDAQHHPRDFFRWGWHPAHPTTFIRKDVLDQVGEFDLRWKLGADYAFLARCMLVPGLNIRHIPKTMVHMRLGGASTSGIGSVLRNNRECLLALNELNVSRAWKTIALKTLRKLPQKFNPGG